MSWLEVCRNWLRFLPAYCGQRSRRRRFHDAAPCRLLLCIADHFEPKGGGASPATARQRVAPWTQNYPRLLGEFRDSDGLPPRHSFFYPIEEYEREHLDELAGLCQAGFGEVEVHLHHDRDTADQLRATLAGFKQLLAERHGLLCRQRGSATVRYGFIHGNWALDNSLPQGRWCGVNNELTILRETGCYADFTLPSWPSAAQTRKINSIYYAVDDPLRPKSHDDGCDAHVGRPPPRDGLLLIQGPLLLNWQRRKWKVLPRVENACIQGNQPPTRARLDLWLRAGVQVGGRPDWVFVKLHTHGAVESNQRVLLGEAMGQFHRALREWSAGQPNLTYHYVTAREMYNLVKAAEAGWTDSVAAARDYELVWNRSTHRAASAGQEHETARPRPAAISPRS